MGREQARKPPIEKPEVGGALAACAVGKKGNDKGRRRPLTEEEQDEQRLLAMRSSKYQREAHRLYHIDELDRVQRLHGIAGQLLLKQYLEFKAKNCSECRNQLHWLVRSRTEYGRVQPPRFITEEEQASIDAERARLIDKYGAGIFNKTEEQIEEENWRRTKEEMFERHLPPPPTAAPPTITEEEKEVETVIQEPEPKYD